MFWPNLISSGDARAEEVGDGRVGLGDHRVGRWLVANAPPEFAFDVAVVADDRVDHPLRDLRPARARRGRRPAGRPAARARAGNSARRASTSKVGIGLRQRGRPVRAHRPRVAHPAPGLYGQPAEPDRRRARHRRTTSRRPAADEREGDFLALLGVADPRLEVVVDARQVVRRSGRRTPVPPVIEAICSRVCGVRRDVERDRPGRSRPGRRPCRSGCRGAIV